jgi:hypothetical protein
VKLNIEPWYKKARRWCQTNLTENDGRDADVNFWRAFWKKHDIQGTIINAGGTVAYFPSENPYQYRAKFLGDRDVTKEFVDAARGEGLAVMARMDINQASEQLYQAHPEWFMQTKDGRPVLMGTRYITCVNGGYYAEQVPAVMREIIVRYKPDALGDNSWTGSNALICYCDKCRKKFKVHSNMDLPESVDFNDPAYRVWLQWSVKGRTEIWNYFNRVTQEIGGEDCLWIGMLHPEFYPLGGTTQLYDDAQLTEYGKFHMVDTQAREIQMGFELNSVNGMMLHQLFGQNTVIIESMASYYKGKYFIRKAAAPKNEMRTWMLAGISAGIAPSPHFIGSIQEDKRIFDNCTPIMSWHRENEKYLFDRELVSNIGLAWSRENLHFYGQDDPAVRCNLPFYGFVRAFIRRRVSYYPVNIRHLIKESDKLDVLVLPDLAPLSDEQLGMVEDFVKDGKSIVFTGASGMLDELGYIRQKFPLDELFGINRSTRTVFEPVLPGGISFKSLGEFNIHNYMRLPRRRHPILNGFDETDIIALYAQYYDVRAVTLETVANFIPPFPTYPPEFAYMDDDKKTSDIPVILAGETPYGGRVVYIAADIDRRYGDAAIPDHGDLLVNAVGWAARGTAPFTVEGSGRLDCRLYKQADALILHLVNFSGLNEWPQPVEEYYPAGRNKVTVNTCGRSITRISQKVAGKHIPFEQKDDLVTFMLDTITSHEMVVIE